MASVGAAKFHKFPVGAGRRHILEGDALGVAVQAVHRPTATETTVLPVPIHRLDNSNQVVRQVLHLGFSTGVWNLVLGGLLEVPVALLVAALQGGLALAAGDPSGMASRIHDLGSSEDHLVVDTWIQVEAGDWCGSNCEEVGGYRIARVAIPCTPNAVPWEALLELIRREAVDIFPADNHRGIHLVGVRPWGRRS